MTAPNVIERINEARRIIAETDFSKSGTVAGKGGYNFIPVGQILQAVRKAHAQAGVTVTFGRPEYDAEQFEKRYTYVKKSSFDGKETTWHAANGHLTATIYGGSVDDRIEMEVPFEAQDNSDKLTNKIITNAERCLYRVLYAIDEGDATDPEAFNFDMPAPEPKGSWRDQARNNPDPFFGKPSAPRKLDAPNEFHTLDDITQRLNLWVRDPRFAEIVKRYGADFGVTADWSEDIVRAMFDECTILARDLGVSE